jgi:hypothetical protein
VVSIFTLMFKNVHAMIRDMTSWAHDYLERSNT